MRIYGGFIKADLPREYGAKNVVSTYLTWGDDSFDKTDALGKAYAAAFAEYPAADGWQNHSAAVTEFPFQAEIKL